MLDNLFYGFRLGTGLVSVEGDDHKMLDVENTASSTSRSDRAATEAEVAGGVHLTLRTRAAVYANRTGSGFIAFAMVLNLFVCRCC